MRKYRENTLLICPDGYKKEILAYNSACHRISDTKYETLASYKKNYYFDYGVKAVKYLVDNYLFSVRNAKEILNNLYYVDEQKVYGQAKLDQLVQYKKELLQNDCLIINPIYKSYLQSKNVVVEGYGQLDHFSAGMLEGKTVEVVTMPAVDKQMSYYHFASQEEEVEFVYNQIFDLLSEGIDINRIYIMNATSDYQMIFERFNNLYPFSVQCVVNDNIAGTLKGKQFIEKVAEGESRQEIYDWLGEKVNDDINKKLIALLNKYAQFNWEEVQALVIHDVMSLSVPVPVLKNVVRCIDSDNPFSGDEYIFLVGFNDQTPPMKKDTDYITDNLKELVGLDKTEQENIRTKENYLAVITNIEHLTITYCQQSPFDQYNPSTLIDETWIKKTAAADYNHSSKLNQTHYAYMLDDLRKYNIMDQQLATLRYNYQDNDYLTYQNSFKGLNEEEIETIDSVRLSYSSMNTFYQCQFRYYLQKILGIDDFKNGFVAKLGTLAHDTLQQYCQNPHDFDFDACWQANLQKQNEKLQKADPADKVVNDVREQYFADRFKEEIKQDIEILKQQNAVSELNQVKCENYFEFNLTDKIKFNGFIDKLMYKKKDDLAAVAIVDYKSGVATKIEKDLFKYGLSLQLPSYLYLMKNTKDKEFKDKKLEFVGLYLQHIINYDLKNDGSTLSDKKSASMKLDGLTTTDVDRAGLLDNSLQAGKKSQVIKSYNLKKDGTVDSRSSSRLISDMEIELDSELVETKVLEAGNAILNGDFKINPKMVNGTNRGCQYCPYLAICYRRDQDKQYLVFDESSEEE